MGWNFKLKTGHMFDLNFEALHVGSYWRLWIGLFFIFNLEIFLSFAWSHVLYLYPINPFTFAEDFSSCFLLATFYTRT